MAEPDMAGPGADRLLMPKLGLTMTEGLLLEWRVAAGEAFQTGDVVFTVETDKVANEIEADRNGVLAEVLVAEGETVAVGTPVARLEGAGARPAAETASAAPARPGTGGAGRDDTRAGMGGGTGGDGATVPTRRAGTARANEPGGGRIVATPLARRLASTSGVDLAAVTGSGPRGRIKAADVEAAAAQRGAPQAAPAGASAGTAGAAPREVVPDAVRLATARRVSAAKRDIPDFSVSHTADVGPLFALRETLNADEARPRVSATHMLIRALGVALAEMPQMNRIWSGDKILAFDTADVGMVAETPAGLRVPVVRDAGRASLDEIAASARQLAERARTGTLAPEDVGGGVISVSNVGMFGVSAMTPIINPPHAMILGVGADRPAFRPDGEGRPIAVRELALTLVCDHRIIDGADAARFLARIVAVLETPVSLLRPPRRAG